MRFENNRFNVVDSVLICEQSVVVNVVETLLCDGVFLDELAASGRRLNHHSTVSVTLDHLPGNFVGKAVVITEKDSKFVFKT